MTTVRWRLVLALSGWLALAATLLPAASPARVVLLLAFVLVCPGAALIRPTRRGTDRLAGVVLTVAVSVALAALVAQAYFLRNAFTVPRAVGTLAVLTTVPALWPGRWRPRPARRPAREAVSRPRSRR